MNELLAGKGAIITGAAEGLGKAIAFAYAQAGMRLALIDIQAEKLRAVVDELTTSGADCYAVIADLSDAAATETAAVKSLALIGTPRVLVHNAALLNERPFAEVDLLSWQRELNVGLQAAYILTHAVWEPMTVAGGGSIIYVSSRSGIVGFAGESVYCASKHGLEGLMKCLAIEGASRNIAVNTVTPGMYMRTPMSERTYPEALKRQWVDPSVLAPAFVQLAAQTADGITGQRVSAWEMVHEGKS